MLSKLVKAALEGEEVLIARDGELVVRLVPLTAKRGLSGWGRLKSLRTKVDAGFEADVETAVTRWRVPSCPWTTLIPSIGCFWRSPKSISSCC